ncbi:MULTISPECIES: efflux RND transporter permease subunit [unclassified Roseitalea]|uniref:efflux RND transporter permease subunit n=1 Tax=unclassified Roseitalea TaxID=2639107 RepID=UPI0027400CEB|nr:MULTISPECIES: efflux RND transporter permease subunit [unclassified Roseitalea]
MRRLIGAAIANRVLPNLLMLALIAGGLLALNTITVKVFPEISTGVVSVSVALPGSSPAEVRDSVVEPIEDALEGLSGIREITATARSDSGSVQAELTRGADVEDVITDIENAIDRITTFPDAAEEPQIVEIEPDELAGQILVTGSVSTEALKSVAETMREELLERDGISQVEVVGVPDDAIFIEVSQADLRRYNISLPQLADRLSGESIDLAAGQIEGASDVIQVTTSGERRTAEDFRRTVLFTSQAGATVELGDIAMVTGGAAPDSRIGRFNGQPAVYLRVNRVGDEQILDIVDSLKAYLDETSLPEGIDARIWRDTASSLQGRIDLLTKNGAIGITLILIVLALFLDIRIAAWVAVGIAVSFIGAFSLMAVFGISINQLSLFGFILALGIVVDDAIVVGEAVYTEQHNEDDPRAAAQNAAIRMAPPVFFSVSTTIAAFVPLLFVPGASGSFIAPVAAIVIIVLVLSLTESFFVLPQHLSSVKPGKPRAWSPRRLTDPARRAIGGRVERFADNGLRKAIAFSVRQPLFVVATAIALLIGSIGLLSGGIVKFVFFPSIEGNFVTAQLELPEGVSETVTLERAQQVADAVPAAARAVAAEHDIEAERIVEGVTITIGFSTASGGPGIAGGGAANVASIATKLIDSSQRAFGAGAFQEAWKQQVGDVVGARSLEFSGNLIGVGSVIALQVSAATQEGRDRAVARLREALEGRDGVLSISDDRFTAAREVELELRPEAQVYGATTTALARQLRAALYGAQVTSLQQGGEEVEVRVRLPEDERNSVADLYDLRVLVGEDFVPLTTLARFSFQQSPSVISRVGGRTVVTLTADVNETVTTGGAETAWLMENVVPGLRERIEGLTVSVGGEQQAQGRTTPALARNFALAMLGIYVILALAFQSYVRPILVIGVVPFGLVGALVGHAVLGLNLTLLSLFGVIGLAGILVNGGLLINDFILEKERRGVEWRTAIVDSTVERFRPILLTTLTTFLGIFPLIQETSVQAKFLIPTAVSLAFGVLGGTVIQMLLMPAYCSIYARLRNAVNRRRRRGTETGQA